MKSLLIGGLGTLVGLIGWYAYHSTICLILGVIAYAIETILEEDSLNGFAKIDIFVAFGVGAAISLIRKTAPWYVGGLLGINIWGAILLILSLLVLGLSHRK